MRVMGHPVLPFVSYESQVSHLFGLQLLQKGENHLPPQEASSLLDTVYGAQRGQDKLQTCLTPSKTILNRRYTVLLSLTLSMTEHLSMAITPL
jgi:hypothetical protein